MKNLLNVLSGMAWPLAMLCVTGAARATAPPTDNPAAACKLAWTESLRWGAVVVITDFPGGDWNERLLRAQDAVVAKGGGVVYFPAGTYSFAESIVASPLPKKWERSLQALRLGHLPPVVGKASRWA